MVWAGGTLLLLATLLGCRAEEPDPPPRSDPPPPPSPTPVDPLGTAPWDPIVTYSDRSIRPLVVDAGGADVELEPLAAANSQVWGWRPVGRGASPGALTVVGVDAPQSTLAEEVTWTVASIGWERPFDADVLANTVWEVVLEMEDIRIPLILRAFWSDDGSRMWLEVGDVSPGGTATFRVVAEVAGEQRCEVLRGAGTVSDDGRLSWSAPRLETELDGVPLTLLDLDLLVGFSPDAASAGGGTFGGRGDAEALSRVLFPDEDEDELCEYLRALFPEDVCAPCDVPSGSCAEGRLAAVELVPSAEELADPLPLCGLDLSDVDLVIEVPPISCDPELDLDLDCGCSAPARGTLPAAWALVAVALRRGRKRE